MTRGRFLVDLTGALAAFLATIRRKGGKAPPNAASAQGRDAGPMAGASVEIRDPETGEWHGVTGFNGADFAGGEPLDAPAIVGERGPEVRRIGGA